MLTDCFVESAEVELEQIFEAPKTELYSWVWANAKHFLDIQKHYKSDCPITRGLDTQDRDILYDTVGLYFTHNHWPRYGDGIDAMGTFKTQLEKSLVRYGWTLKEG